MTTTSQNTVVQEFLEDHKQFMRLLHDVGIALGDRDLPRAQALAEQLDAVAGPHIAFEESVLYPAVERGTRDPAFVKSLYQEHGMIVQALSRLIQDRELDESSLQQITTAFRQGLGHAEHCGTLVSRLAALDENEQQIALKKLRQLRKTGGKWTQAVAR